MAHCYYYHCYSTSVGEEADTGLAADAPAKADRDPWGTSLRPSFRHSEELETSAAVVKPLTGTSFNGTHIGTEIDSGLTGDAPAKPGRFLPEPAVLLTPVGDVQFLPKDPGQQGK